MPLPSYPQQCLEIFGVPKLIRKSSKEWIYFYYFLRKFSTHLNLNLNLTVNLREAFKECFKSFFTKKNSLLSFDQRNEIFALEKALISIIYQIASCGYISEFKLFLQQIKKIDGKHFLKITAEEQLYSSNQKILDSIISFWEKHEQWQFFLDQVETIPLPKKTTPQRTISPVLLSPATPVQQTIAAASSIQSITTELSALQLTATTPPILLAQSQTAICRVSLSPKNKKVVCYHLNPGGDDFLSFIGEETMIAINTTSAHFSPLQLEWSSDEKYIAILGEDIETTSENTFSENTFFVIILVEVTTNTQRMIALPPNSCQPIMRAHQSNIFVCPNNTNFYFVNFSDFKLTRTGRCSEGIIKHTKTINETLLWIGIQHQRLYHMTYGLQGMVFCEQFKTLKGYIPEINNAKQLCTNTDNSLVYYDNQPLSQLYQFNIATNEHKIYTNGKISAWCLLNDDEVLVAHGALLIRHHFENKRTILCCSGIDFTTLQVLPRQPSPNQYTVYLTTATAVYQLILDTIG